LVAHSLAAVVLDGKKVARVTLGCAIGKPILLPTVASIAAGAGQWSDGLASEVARATAHDIKATGAEVHWAIDDPHELELAVPKLRFVEDISAYMPEHAARMGWPAKLFVRLWKHIPALRKVGRLLRYRF